MHQRLRYLIAKCLGSLALIAMPGCQAGCSQFAKVVADSQQHGDKAKGMTYYLGGAGPLGNAGSLDVPAGLADGGYEGHVEVYPWQGLIPIHAMDQINLSRNLDKGAELARAIRRYHRDYPAAEINIIALSAGTGVAAFALEDLPESITVNNVVFLGCSLSSRYDLTRALRRVRGCLYVVHSAYDDILGKLLPVTGTVDRSSASDGVAGIEGFRIAEDAGSDTKTQYQKLHNIGYRWDFAETGYGGGHIDSTSREFIAKFIAPAILGDGSVLLGEPEAAGRVWIQPPPSTSTRPARPSLDLGRRSPTTRNSRIESEIGRKEAVPRRDSIKRPS